MVGFRREPDEVECAWEAQGPGPGGPGKPAPGGPPLGALCLGLLALVALLALRWWQLGSYAVFAEELDARWGFLLGGRAPVWLGEFGTDRDSRWWRHLARYVSERRVSFAYWPVNGEKRVGLDEERPARRRPRSARRLFAPTGVAACRVPPPRCVCCCSDAIMRDHDQFTQREIT
jgi:hypothetical protein